MQLTKKFYLLLIFTLPFLPYVSHGQILLVTGNTADQEVLQHYPVPKTSKDSVAAMATLQKLISDLQQDGFFTAHVTAFNAQQDTIKVAVEVGNLFQWIRLNPGNLNPVLQEKIGFREKMFLEKPFRYDEIRRLFEELLAYAENNGYPFATVQLSQVSIDHGKVSAAVNYQQGPEITFGRLHIKGTQKVKPDFLAAFLGIYSGHPYDERKIQQIPETIRLLTYLSLTAPVEVTYQNESVDINLTLSEQKTNAFDGILNFFPAEGNGQKLLLTGEMNIHLNNLAKSGKRV